MQLLLLGTAGCHLCEEAEYILAEYGKQHRNLILDIIDIAEQTKWQDSYAVRIPVLYHPATQSDLGWPFDLPAVTHFLSGLDND